VAKRRPLTPLLDSLIAADVVRTDGIEYIGRASDGVEVTIGCVLTDKDLVRLEAWLRDYPTPDKW